MKKCPSCGSTDLVNDFETYECNDCGQDSDMFHFELQAENDKLREALESIFVMNNDKTIMRPWNNYARSYYIAKKALK